MLRACRRILLQLTMLKVRLACSPTTPQDATVLLVLALVSECCLLSCGPPSEKHAAVSR